MPTAHVNGVELYYEETGSGDVPLLLVHGSWGSHDNWEAVVPGLAEHFLVVTYDRRGHSSSQRLPGQGSVREDVADAAALIEHLRLEPAWVLGNSFGASITLRLAGSRRDLLRGAVVHEPPLLSLVASPPGTGDGADDDEPMATVLERIAAGDHDGAAELFVDAIAIGPGTWAGLPQDMKATFVENAPTFLDECLDPDQFAFDLAWISDFPHPCLVTHGGTSPPVFKPIVEAVAGALPRVELATLIDAGHIPHVTHPEEFVDRVCSFVQQNS